MHPDFARELYAAKGDVAGRAPRPHPGGRIAPERLLQRTLERRQGLPPSSAAVGLRAAENAVELLLYFLAGAAGCVRARAPER